VTPRYTSRQAGARWKPAAQELGESRLPPRGLLLPAVLESSTQFFRTDGI